MGTALVLSLVGGALFFIAGKGITKLLNGSGHHFRRAFFKTVKSDQHKPKTIFKSRGIPDPRTKFIERLRKYG